MDVPPTIGDNVSNLIEKRLNCPDCGQKMITEYCSEPTDSIVHWCEHCGFYQGVTYGRVLALSEENSKDLGLYQIYEYLQD